MLVQLAVIYLGVWKFHIKKNRSHITATSTFNEDNVVNPSIYFCISLKVFHVEHSHIH